MEVLALRRAVAVAVAVADAVAVAVAVADVVADADAVAVADAVADAVGRYRARNCRRPECLPWQECYSPRSPFWRDLTFNDRLEKKRRDHQSEQIAFKTFSTICFQPVQFPPC